MIDELNQQSMGDGHSFYPSLRRGKWLFSGIAQTVICAAKKPKVVFTRVGALQKAVVLSKSSAIRLRNADLQPLWPFSLLVIAALMMPDLISGNINAMVIMIAEKAADLIRCRAPLAPVNGGVLTANNLHSQALL